MCRSPLHVSTHGKGIRPGTKPWKTYGGRTATSDKHTWTAHPVCAAKPTSAGSRNLSPKWKAAERTHLWGPPYAILATLPWKTPSHVWPYRYPQSKNCRCILAYATPRLAFFSCINLHFWGLKLGKTTEIREKITKNTFFWKIFLDLFCRFKEKPYLCIANENGSLQMTWKRFQKAKERKLKSRWSLRLSVRTRDFHSLKRSSTLLGTTKLNELFKRKDGKP